MAHREEAIGVEVLEQLGNSCWEDAAHAEKEREREGVKEGGRESPGEREGERERERGREGERERERGREREREKGASTGTGDGVNESIILRRFQLVCKPPARPHHHHQRLPERDFSPHPRGPWPGIRGPYRFRATGIRGPGFVARIPAARAATAWGTCAFHAEGNAPIHSLEAGGQCTGAYAPTGRGQRYDCLPKRRPPGGGGFRSKAPPTGWRDCTDRSEPPSSLSLSLSLSLSIYLSLSLSLSLPAGLAETIGPSPPHTAVQRPAFDSAGAANGTKGVAEKGGGGGELCVYVCVCARVCVRKWSGGGSAWRPERRSPAARSGQSCGRPVAAASYSSASTTRLTKVT